MSGEIGAGRRRPPSLYALGIVVVTTLVGFGLYVRGPVNPNVVVDLGDSDGGPQGASQWAWTMIGAQGSFGTGQGVGHSGRVEADLKITNHSFAPLRLTSVRLEMADSDDRVAPTISQTRGIPTKVGHDEAARVTVTVDARAWCAAHPGDRFEYQVLIDAKTSWGITRTIGHNGEASFSCTEDLLPPAGTAPADATLARAHVADAFATAYDFFAPPAQRKASVDDPAGLEAVVATAQTGPYASALDDVRVDITEVVFTSATEAAVLYDLAGDHVTYATGRIGHARLVDGRWKVTRATVCADLALAQMTCPPG